MTYATTYPSPMGTITLACDEAGAHIVGLWLEGQKYGEETTPEKMTERHDLPIFEDTKAWLDRYFAGDNPDLSDIPIAPVGSHFRQQVWDILCEIPYGEVITYGAIAKMIAKKRNLKRMSAQAVGGAVGHNPISIIIPCHRVVGAHGNLTGYGGGIQKKIQLLELEGVDTSRFFIPKKGTAL